jgi:YihY family inner membrane protein
MEDTTSSNPRRADTSVAPEDRAGATPEAATPLRRPGVIAFWIKINNDWIFNLSGLLAYNFLMSMVPILILLLAVVGFALQLVLPDAQALLQRGVTDVLPSPVGNIVTTSVADHLRSSAHWLLVVGIGTSIITGSRLFVTLEGALGIVFRLRGRNPIQQNIMALGMLFIYVLLVPLLIFASILPAAVVGVLDPHNRSLLAGIVLAVLGFLVAFLAALSLFGLIYLIVPNRARRRWRIGKGTLVASLLLVVYEVVFPLYERFLLHPNNYGSVAGFAVVILLFFYYLAFILLLGAEINSWDIGQRETGADLPGILHAIQAHDSTAGAAGPTAGQPQEELQVHHRWWPGRRR